MPGVYAADILTWGDAKAIARELKKPQVQAMYDSVVFDTVDIAGTLCEKYICSQAGVDRIGDIPYGQGWTLMKKEFEELVRSITHMGYAVFFISHDKDKEFKRKDGTAYNQTIPSCPTSFNEIVKNLADIYAYAEKYEENGRANVRLVIRSIDNSIDCGCRFKYIDPVVPMSYDALVDALNRAIDLEAAETNGEFVTNDRNNQPIERNLDYDALMRDFGELANTLMTRDAEYFGPRITFIVEKYLGKGKKISESTLAQVELVDQIVSEIKDTLI